MKIYSNGKFNIYGLKRLFSKGNKIVIRPTLKCNLACLYCGAEMPGSACWVDPGPELMPAEWFAVFEQYEKKNGRIMQIGLSGGEPFLYNHIVELIEGLLDRDKFVYIFSNLTLRSGLKVRKSNRVKIKATYHDKADKRIFERNLKDYSKKFFVIHQELYPTNSVISESAHRDMYAADDVIYLRCDLFGPDGTIYPRDEKPDPEKYRKRRLEKVGMIANPYREKLLQIRDV